MTSSRDHKFSTAYRVHTLLHIRRKSFLCCLSGSESARPTKRQSALGGRRRAAPLAAVPVSGQAREPAAGSSPPPHTPSVVTTLPTPTNTDDTHPQPWRPNGVPMRRRVKARFSRAEQVTATRATVGATHAPACSHEGDRGGLSTRLLLQQRAGTHTSRAMRARWRPQLSSTPRSAVDSKPTRSTRSNSGQVPSAASLRPSSRRPARKSAPRKNFGCAELRRAQTDRGNNNGNGSPALSVL